MITGIGSVAVLVNDAKKSAKWYQNKLGFEVVGIEGHVIFVKPKGSAGVMLHLCERCDIWGKDEPGGRTGIWLQCVETKIRKDQRTRKVFPASKSGDSERAYRKPKENGVRFSEELSTTNWGKYAIFTDPDGNEFETS